MAAFNDILNARNRDCEINKATFMLGTNTKTGAESPIFNFYNSGGKHLMTDIMSHIQPVTFALNMLILKQKNQKHLFQQQPPASVSGNSHSSQLNAHFTAQPKKIV